MTKKNLTQNHEDDINPSEIRLVPVTKQLHLKNDVLHHF